MLSSAGVLANDQADLKRFYEVGGKRLEMAVPGISFLLVGPGGVGGTAYTGHVPS